VLLLEHDINTSPFTPAVHACVPPLPWSVTQTDVDQPNRYAPLTDIDSQNVSTNLLWVWQVFNSWP